MTDLVTKDHFTDLRTQILEFKEKNKSVVFDYVEDEKEARSYVATMRKSKTAVNNRHKEKKKFFLEEGRKIDAGKNELIADIDGMIAVHAEPLQAIKDQKEAEEEAERQKIAMGLDWDEALSIDDLFNREREMTRKEAEQAQMEADRVAAEEAEIADNIRIQREKRIKEEAEEKAKKDAEEKLAFEQAEKERLIQESIKREEQIKIGAEAEKVKVENARIEADKKAKREQQEAIDTLKREQEAKEKAEADRLAKEKAIDDARKADEDHRRSVNNLILSHFVEAGLTEDAGKKLIGVIVTGGVPNLSINY